jgi:predicted short-subunit dehydrogenase-like oxidoreductase (DUF2520 family)
VPSRLSTERRSRSRATISSSTSSPGWRKSSGPRRFAWRPARSHAAAVLAAGGFDALLDAIAELGHVAGVDEAGSLAIYGGLIEQTLGNARELGVAAALTGPMTRGDAGTLRAHLAALRTNAPSVETLYRALAAREIALAERRGSLTPEAAAELRATLAGSLATTV